MNVRYNIEKLKSILDDLGKVTGLTLAILNTEFEFLYTRGKENDGDEFCTSVHKIESCAFGCLMSDREMLLECQRTKKPVSHICHAGLRDTVVPILKSDVISGYVIIGRVRPHLHFEPKLDIFHSDLALWQSRYEKLSYLSVEQLESFINLLSHILFENAITIDCGELMDKAVAYIDAHICEPISVGSICSALFVSKNRLYEGFHSYFNCTVNEYVTGKRISLAKKLLLATDKPAAEIAAEVGMENYSYFSKLFKRRTGRSPSEFRK